MRVGIGAHTHHSACTPDVPGADPVHPVGAVISSIVELAVSVTQRLFPVDLPLALLCDLVVIDTLLLSFLF